MRKTIMAIISAALIITGLTACSGEEKESSEPIGGSSSNESTSSEIVDSSESGNSQSESDSDSSSTDFDYDYITAHRYDNVIKQRGVYGETEIPDIHYENAGPEGGVVHVPFADGQWQYFGLESMEFERLTLGDYTIKLIGCNVRTDKENFPDRIFASGLQIEIEKDGAIIPGGGGYLKDLTNGWGAQYYSEDIVFPDKIGSYLAAYELEYPVIAARYYFADGEDRPVSKAVEFSIIKDDEHHTGFGCICEPGCGVAFNSSPTSYKDMNIVNVDFGVWRAALFEADEFKVVDKNTLLDEVAGIIYTFNFEEHPIKHSLPFELYTAEKNVGSVAAAMKITKTYP